MKIKTVMNSVKNHIHKLEDYLTLIKNRTPKMFLENN